MTNAEKVKIKNPIKKINEQSNSNKKYKVSRNIKRHSKLYNKGEITDNVTIKSKFKGKKQNEWLKFYQKNMIDECIEPKTTSLFSKCIEYRNQASKYFEMLWRKQNPLAEAPSPVEIEIIKNPKNKAK